MWENEFIPRISLIPTDANMTFQTENILILYRNLLYNDYQQKWKSKLKKKLVNICQVQSYNYTPHYQKLLQLQSFRYLKHKDNSVQQNIIYQEVFNRKRCESHTMDATIIKFDVLFSNIFDI